MVDIVVTAANVVQGTGAKQPTHGIAGAAITAGQGIVKDASISKYVPADANHATVALRTPDGIALNGAALNQPVAVHTEGPITIGGTVVVGETYIQSANPGGVAPIADAVAGMTITHFGVGISATQIDVKINKSGATK